MMKYVFYVIESAIVFGSNTQNGRTPHFSRLQFAIEINPEGSIVTTS